MAGKHFKVAPRKPAEYRIGSWGEAFFVFLAGVVLLGILVFVGEYVAHEGLRSDRVWLRWVLYGLGVWLVMVLMLPRLAVLGRSASLDRGQLLLRWGPMVRWVDLRRVSRIARNKRVVAIHGLDGAWLVRPGRLGCTVEELIRAWRHARRGCLWRPLSPPRKLFPSDMPLGWLAVTALAWGFTVVATAASGGVGLALWIVGVGTCVLLLWAWVVGRQQDLKLSAEALEICRKDRDRRWELASTQWLAWAAVDGGAMVELHGQDVCHRVFCLEDDAALLGNMVQRKAPHAPQLDLEEGRAFVPPGGGQARRGAAVELQRRLQAHNRRKVARLAGSTIPRHISSYHFPLAFVAAWLLDFVVGGLACWWRGRRQAVDVGETVMWAQGPMPHWEKEVRALPEKMEERG
jgi:hypothetical protein